MSDITSKTAERSPYILVCFQECERMNTLIFEIRRSLKELDLGLNVRSTFSSCVHFVFPEQNMQLPINCS